MFKLSRLSISAYFWEVVPQKRAECMSDLPCHSSFSEKHSVKPRILFRALSFPRNRRLIHSLLSYKVVLWKWESSFPCWHFTIEEFYSHFNCLREKWHFISCLISLSLMQYGSVQRVVQISLLLILHKYSGNFFFIILTNNCLKY